MDASALASAESWLSGIAVAKLIAVAMVAFGVAIEFGTEWAARPFERTVKDAHELQIATLEREAEAARGEIAKANAEVAIANERTANLEKDAAQLKAANLALEERIAWRHLSKEQYDKMVNAITGHKISVAIKYISDPEALSFAEDFARALSASGNKPTNGGTLFINPPVTGLLIVPSTNDDASLLSAAFKSAGISFGPMSVTPLPTSVEIWVGGKAPPF